MKVLHVGGSGLFGLPTARRLAASEAVSEIAIAGRSQAAIDRAVAEVGFKATGVRLDARDAGRVSAAAADYDLVVNTAGPEWEVLLPSLRGAIEAGTHYCDIGAFGNVVRDQLALDPTAKDRNVVAVVGIGFDPGLDNLLAAYACGKFDAVEEVELRHRWFRPEVIAMSVDLYRKNGHVDLSMQGTFKALNEPAPVYRDGSWTEVDALEEALQFALPGGRVARAFPFGTSEAITLPRYFPGVLHVSTVLIVEPPELAELLERAAREMRTEGLAPSDAANSFLKRLTADPERWRKMREGLAPADWHTSAAVTGRRAGRRVRITCWPEGLPSSTIIPLTVAALRILRGEISARGVLAPEGCFEPMPFFEEAATYAKEEQRKKPLLGESIEEVE